MQRDHRSNRKIGFSSVKWCVLGGALAVISFLLGRVSAEEPAFKPQILSIASVLMKHPMKGDEAFKVIPLAQGQDLSVTTVRAARELPPHFHNDREEVAYVVRGGGTMLLGGEKRPVKAGDVIYIPRKVPHGFVNGATRETVVVSVMAPPFDGKDRHFLHPPAKSGP